MRRWIIAVLGLFLWVLISAPTMAGELLQYDGWVRWGYSGGAQWGDMEVQWDDFYWGRLNFHGQLNDNLSYYIRFQGIQLNNPLGEPFRLEPLWYHLSLKTSIGQFDFGRLAVLSTVNEELIFEANAIYGTTLVYYPALTGGFSGSLAFCRNEDMYPLGTHGVMLAQLNYLRDPWSIDINYFKQQNQGIVDDSTLSLELAYKMNSGLSINLELGQNVVYMPKNPLVSPLYGEKAALVGLRYADPHWIVFVGYNFPVEHYAVDILYLFNRNWGIRTEFNNSFANYSPGFQVSFYYMFSSDKRGEGEE